MDTTEGAPHVVSSPPTDPSDGMPADKGMLSYISR